MDSRGCQYTMWIFEKLLTCFDVDPFYPCHLTSKYFWIARQFAKNLFRNLFCNIFPTILSYISCLTTHQFKLSKSLSGH